VLGGRRFSDYSYEFLHIVESVVDCMSIALFTTLARALHIKSERGKEFNMIDNAVSAAERAFEEYAELSPLKVAAFLDQIAEEIVALGDSLIKTACEETALTADRLNGERTRTVNQLRLFATVARDGTWKDVRIEPALPDRKPLRRPIFVAP
jgi:acyl-CoA reductase-like NAD-dependent aldehyde dehydrogenase